jgi:putative PIN family toxin of toxin-antitoxin system
LLEELSEVLTRPVATRQLAMIGRSPRDVLADYLAIIELEPQPLPQPVCRDPDDDHVLACALTAAADLIVSGDRDLLDLGAFGAIRILKPSEALAELTHSSG